MTTVTELVTQAFREGNLKAVGSSLTAAELAEGIGRFNSFVTSLFGTELGAHLKEWEVPSPLRTASIAANFPQLPYPTETLGDGIVAALSSDQWPYPPQNSRLVVGITDAATVYLPQFPDDGARMAFTAIDAMTATLTLDANGRAIEGAATAALTNAESPRSWLYRSDIASWQRITTLVAADESPLPADMDDLLVCGLSIRMSPRYGQEPRQGTVMMYKKMLTLAITRYAQSGTTVYRSGDVPRAPQGYSAAGWMG